MGKHKFSITPTKVDKSHGFRGTFFLLFGVREWTDTAGSSEMFVNCNTELQEAVTQNGLIL